MSASGFFKENGKTKPITPKNGITPEQLKISVKGNNDKIEINTKRSHKTFSQDEFERMIVDVDKKFPDGWILHSWEEAREYLKSKGYSTDSILGYKHEMDKMGFKWQVDNKKIKLQNRASVGIRAYTEPIEIEDVPVLFEIMEHAVLGRYIISPEALDHKDLPKSLWGINKVEFKTFDAAKRYLENKFKIKIELDRETSNDYQTWEQNIEQTDHELPYERIFWHLPERVRERKTNVGESMEEFLKREKLI